MNHAFRSFAIIPAAGRSRRMGQPKLLLPWKTSTVIEHVIGAWQASGADEIVTVVRREDRRLTAVCLEAGAFVTHPPSEPPDMKASIQWGLTHIRQNFQPEPADVWLLAPADMPNLPAGDIDVLIGQHDPSHATILVPTYRGRRGHPVLFPWPLHEAVHDLAADQGVNALLRQHRVRELECSNSGILDDLDRPADYERLRSLE